MEYLPGKNVMEDVFWQTHFALIDMASPMEIHSYFAGLGTLWLTNHNMSLSVKEKTKVI